MRRWLWGAVWLGLSACAPRTSEGVQPDRVSMRRDPGCAQAPAADAPRVLPFGFYSAPVPRFEELAAAGVTMVGPYYGKHPSEGLLDAAGQAGLGVLYPIGLEMAQIDEQGRDDLAAQVGAVADNETIAGWYVLPEELRPWSEAEMLYAAWVRAVVRHHDPLDRPLLSYQPNHRTTEALTEASASFDIVLRGLYANFVGAKSRRAWVREGARRIVASAHLDQAPWAVLEMFEEPADSSRIRAWVRHDVYASLVAGARGVVVFSGWPRPGFPAYEAYLAAYLEVATELNGPRGLATPLLRGRASRPVGLEIVGGPTRTDASMEGGPRWVPSIATRQVRDRDSLWIYAVNSAQAAVRVRLVTPPAACPPVAVVGPAVRAGVLELPPLGVAVVRIPSPGDTQSPRPTKTRPTRPLALP